MSARAIAIVGAAGIGSFALYQWLRPARRAAPSPIAPTGNEPRRAGAVTTINPRDAFPDNELKNSKAPLVTYGRRGANSSNTKQPVKRRAPVGTSTKLTPQERNETIDEAWQKIKGHEGWRTSSYKDTLGFRTIGYGFKIADRNKLADRKLEPYARDPNLRIGRQEAEAIGTSITANTHDQIADLFSVEQWRGFSPRQKSALVDMGYQLGPAGVSRFRKTLGLLKAGRNREAGLEAGRSQWALQTPERAADIAIDLSNGTLTRDELPWIE